MSIQVRDLWKTHRGAPSPTLREITFDVEQGALVAIVGKSGAGKSTLLRVLSGLDAYDRGSVEVAGVDDKRAPLRGRVGLVFQSLELFPHLTVLENVLLAPVRIHQRDAKESFKRASSLLKDLDLADKKRAYPEELSGGQKQRVAIVRALMVEPKVMLYDEPTSALDPSLKAEVGKTLQKVASSTGMTQVVVTHDLNLAQTVCSAVYVLDGGQLRRS